MARKGGVEVDLRQPILDLLAKAGKLTYEEIAAKLKTDGIAPYSEELWGMLRQLMKAGEVVDVGEKKRSFYALAPTA